MSDIQTGDTVFHRPTNETWLVAYVRGERVAWIGWPCGEALLEDCDLIATATAEERAKLIRDMAGMFDADPRREYARAVLAVGRLTREERVADAERAEHAATMAGLGDGPDTGDER